ncbi:hypothetical protein NKG94_31890 [Micromonospora sp. M12]
MRCGPARGGPPPRHCGDPAPDVHPHPPDHRLRRSGGRRLPAGRRPRSPVRLGRARPARPLPAARLDVPTGTPTRLHPEAAALLPPGTWPPTPRG